MQRSECVSMSGLHTGEDRTEQFHGNGRDIFAVGVSIYEAVWNCLTDYL
jgi:hypothetical protein